MNAPTTTERPPLNPARAEPINQALDKAYAISMLLASADDDVPHKDDAAMALLDYIDAAREELAKLTGVRHG